MNGIINGLIVKMNNQFSDSSAPNPNESFHCSPHDTSNGFTHLMKLVLMTNNVEAIELIKEIIINNPKETNKQNEKDCVLATSAEDLLLQATSYVQFGCYGAAARQVWHCRWRHGSGLGATPKRLATHPKLEPPGA